MTRPRVLFTDHPWPDLEIERAILEAVDVEILDAPCAEEEVLRTLVPGVNAIAVCWAQVRQRVLEAATDCRLVARMGIGLDNIDVVTATQLGMRVTNVPDYCIDEVAEHTLALIFALGRNLGQFHAATKAGRYDLSAAPPMHRFRGRTLGVLGFGRIGRAVAEKATGLGLRVIACNASGEGHGTGVAMVPFDRLLAESDFLSLHLPLTESTRQIINAEALTRLKPGACLVNTSRGGLIDQAALWEALAEDRLTGVGLDVFDPEPPDLSLPLYRDPRVIATPHAAFVSEESLVELRTRVARQIEDVLCGRDPQNTINR